MTIEDEIKEMMAEGEKDLDDAIVSLVDHIETQVHEIEQVMQINDICPLCSEPMDGTKQHGSGCK